MKLGHIFNRLADSMWTDICVLDSIFIESPSGPFVYVSGLIMNLSKQRSSLRTLFWDVAFDSIDWQKHARFVINRVVTRGNLDD